MFGPDLWLAWWIQACSSTLAFWRSAAQRADADWAKQLNR